MDQWIKTRQEKRGTDEDPQLLASRRTRRRQVVGASAPARGDDARCASEAPQAPGHRIHTNHHKELSDADRQSADGPCPRALQTRLVLDPAAVAAFRVPNGDIRTTITINVAGRTVTADLASKSIRKGAATIGEHGADAVAVVLQGKLQADNSLAEAGLSVQLKAPAVAKAAAAESPRCATANRDQAPAHRHAKSARAGLRHSAASRMGCHGHSAVRRQVSGRRVSQP